MRFSTILHRLPTTPNHFDPRSSCAASPTTSHYMFSQYYPPPCLHRYPYVHLQLHPRNLHTPTSNNSKINTPNASAILTTLMHPPLKCSTPLPTNRSPGSRTLGYQNGIVENIPLLSDIKYSVTHVELEHTQNLLVPGVEVISFKNRPIHDSPSTGHVEIYCSFSSTSSGCPSPLYSQRCAITMGWSMDNSPPTPRGYSPASTTA